MVPPTAGDSLALHTLLPAPLLANLDLQMQGWSLTPLPPCNDAVHVEERWTETKHWSRIHLVVYSTIMAPKTSVILKPTHMTRCVTRMNSSTWTTILWHVWHLIHFSFFCFFSSSFLYHSLFVLCVSFFFFTSYWLQKLKILFKHRDIENLSSLFIQVSPLLFSLVLEIDLNSSTSCFSFFCIVSAVG